MTQAVCVFLSFFFRVCVCVEGGCADGGWFVEIVADAGVYVGFYACAGGRREDPDACG